MAVKDIPTSNRRFELGPGIIALLYAVFSVLWIALTDAIVNTVSDPRTRLVLNTTKGIGFVIITALLLYLVISRLVHRMRQAQRSLAASEAEYRGVVRGANEGVCRLTRQNRIGFVNPRLATWLQRGEEELIGLPLSDFLHESEQRAFADQLDRWNKGIAEQHDFCLRASDGSEITAIVSGTPIFGPGNSYSGCVLMLMDITERQRMEHLLQHSQKMEAVGRLAGGIAHDFNNILGIIIGYATLLKSQFKDGDKGKEYSASILGSSERAAALIRKMLAFSRKQEQSLQLAVIDLNEVVSDFAKMLPFVIGTDIRIALSTAPTPATVYADAGQIEQILMNLATNACDAMPKGGDLLVETGRMQSTSIPGTQNIIPGLYSFLRVTDSGTGMSAETKAMIFEPFFTTKDVGKGTGLGLSVVYGIIKQSKGYIVVESQPQQGSAFTVYLPFADAVVQPQAPASPEQTQLNPCGGETILLVEDEGELRTLSAKILTQQGYKVIEAKDRMDALEISRKSLPEIDLVLSDLSMPNMGGRELASRLLELKPDLRIFFISGYAPSHDSEELASHCIVLEKPINPSELLKEVRRILDSDNTRPNN